jgi:hypothetical protein
MTGVRDRRAVPRTTVSERPAARVRGMREVRLLDLSVTGAQIEHLDVFRIGASCALDLPLSFGVLNLPAQVVWCTVIGRKHKVGGESHLVVRSGLRFATLTRAQHAALAGGLQHLAAAPQPFVDSHRGSA